MSYVFGGDIGINTFRFCVEKTMKKLLVAIFLFLTSNSVVVAEWTPVGVRFANITEFKSDRIYADYATIRKAGSMVKMWSLTDYTDERKGIGHKYLSSKVQGEYDCKEEQYRILYITRHSGNMGRGEAINSIVGPSQWEPVAPESIAKMLWEVACKEDKIRREKEKIDFFSYKKMLKFYTAPDTPPPQILTETKWVEVSEINKSTGDTYYFDPTTIYKNDQFRQVWELLDPESDPDSGNRGYSFRWKKEYDCKKKRFRRLYEALHYENMGLGSFGENDKIYNWSPIELGTREDIIFTIVCDK